MGTRGRAITDSQRRTFKKLLAENRSRAEAARIAQISKGTAIKLQRESEKGQAGR